MRVPAAPSLTDSSSTRNRGPERAVYQPSQRSRCASARIPAERVKLFNGQLDDVTIWSIALTDSQINDLMNTPPQGSESGLQGYWRFDENGGSTAHDWTGHGYDASLGAGVTWTKSTAPINP